MELSTDATSVLSEARQVHIAVASARGPHVTPELYSWSAGRLWFAAATTTLKSRVMAREHLVGGSVSVPGRSLVMTGTVEAFDPRHVLALVRRAPRLPAAGLALAEFTARNATDLLAFAVDTLTGRLGFRPPPLRVLYAVTPIRAALFENDALVESWAWPHTVGRRPIAAMPPGGERAVVALPGPVAMPARWFVDQQRVHLPAAAAPLVPARERFPLSVVTDDYRAPGPAAKVGVLARGSGRVVPAGGDACVIEVDTHAIVEWDGIETRTTETD